MHCQVSNFRQQQKLHDNENFLTVSLETISPLIDAGHFLSKSTLLFTFEHSQDNFLHVSSAGVVIFTSDQ